MHGIGNLAAQIGRYGLAVDNSRAHVHQPISSEQGLAWGHNFLQRREQRWAVARNQKTLEAAPRARDKRDVAGWDADRLGEQSNESSVGFTGRPSASTCTPSMASQPPFGVNRTASAAPPVAKAQGLAQGLVPGLATIS